MFSVGQGSPFSCMKTNVQIQQGVEDLFGVLDGNLKLMEDYFRVSAHLEDATLELEGPAEQVQRVEQLVREYTDLVEQGAKFDPVEVQSFLRIISEDPRATLKGLNDAG